MTIKELIKQLKAFPDGVQVLVQGYEDGYDSIKSIKETAVTKKTNAADYNGEYDDTENSGTNSVKAVVIMGNRR